MLVIWTLLVVCVFGDYVERYSAFYIRQHVDWVPSPNRYNHVCYRFRYRSQLGQLFFPEAGLPAVSGKNFTLSFDQCNWLLDFDVREAKTNIKYYYKTPDCPGPELAMMDLMVVASIYRLMDFGNFTEILGVRDWTQPLSEAEAMGWRNSRFCRIERPGECEDDLELFNRGCPPLPTTPAEPRKSSDPKVSWKLPWEQFTFRT